MPMQKAFLQNHTRDKSHVLNLIDLVRGGEGGCRPSAGTCRHTQWLLPPKSPVHLYKGPLPSVHEHFLPLASFPVIILLHLDFSLKASCFCCQFPERESHHRVGCTRIPWHRKASLGSLSPSGSPVTHLGHWLPTTSMLASNTMDVHKRWAMELNWPEKDKEQDPRPGAGPLHGRSSQTPSPCFALSICLQWKAGAQPGNVLILSRAAK